MQKWINDLCLYSLLQLINDCRTEIRIPCYHDWKTFESWETKQKQNACKLLTWKVVYMHLGIILLYWLLSSGSALLVAVGVLASMLSE